MKQWQFHCMGMSPYLHWECQYENLYNNRMENESMRGKEGREGEEGKGGGRGEGRGEGEKGKG